MATSLRSPSGRLRLPPSTARLRLTLLYTGLFLLLGTVLLALTVVLTHTSSAISISAVPVRRGSIAAAMQAIPAAQVKSGVVAQRNADFGRLLTVSWVALALAALGATLIGWFAAGRVLRPLRAITATARTISVGNLHSRLALEGPDDEFKQLGDTLDELLGRLEASFEAQRRFVANASHELRTPLTLQRALLQVALADPGATTESLRTTGQELLALQAEQERLLEALLTLASSERGLDRREPLDLADLIEPALAPLRGEIERLGLVLEVAAESSRTLGDPALMRRLIANLLDNAVAHNTPGGRVEIRTGRQDDQAVLTVSNTGPLVDAADVERLFEPFQQLGSSRTADDGHRGLGLSIVRAIATAHDATVVAHSRLDGGLVVIIRLPAAP